MLYACLAEGLDVKFAVGAFDAERPRGVLRAEDGISFGGEAVLPLREVRAVEGELAVHRAERDPVLGGRSGERQLGVGVNATTPDGLFSVEAVRCLGCCGLAPVAVVNGDVHGKLETKDVAGIIEKYRTLG